jgi:hypothetical protein
MKRRRLSSHKDRFFNRLLGKGSLYHFFPGGKEDMAKAVLDEVAVWF